MSTTSFGSHAMLLSSGCCIWIRKTPHATSSRHATTTPTIE